MRDTKRKRAIIEMLERHDDEWQYTEHGPQPYTATTIASEIGGSVQSVARTLRGMASEGLVISVRDRQDVWNAIANGHYEMPVTAYYSAATIEESKAAAEMWRSGTKARSEEALKAFAAIAR